jgi:alpha-L-rhamnosidase-like protein
MVKPGPAPVPMLRREFKLGGPVEQARAYVTAHGLYELYLNGQRVGDQLFTPGWTSYNKRLQYQTYDVTPLLKAGANAVGAMLGNGWYRGNLAWEGRRNIYGDRLALLAQIQVTYKDGRSETIGSDPSWRAATGPILMSEIYHGETYDARLEKAGWAAAGFDDHAWSGVKVADLRKDDLIAPAGPPVTRIQELRPVKIFTTPGGAGIDTDEAAPGYKHILIQPRPGGRFTDVEASHETPYGKVAAWTRKDGTFDLRLELPANTRATVRLPKAQLAAVSEGGRPLAAGNGISGPQQDGETVVVEVGSGAYRFAYPMVADEKRATGERP